MTDKDFQKIVLEKLTNLEEGQKNLERRQTSLEEGQKNLERRQASLEEGQKNLERRQASLEEGQKNLERRQASLEEGQKNLEKKIDAVYEQAAELLEFKTETAYKLNKILDDNKSTHEIIGEHEIYIRSIRRYQYTIDKYIQVPITDAASGK